MLSCRCNYSTVICNSHTRPGNCTSSMGIMCSITHCTLPCPCCIISTRCHLYMSGSLICIIHITGSYLRSSIRWDMRKRIGLHLLVAKCKSKAYLSMMCSSHEMSTHNNSPCMKCTFVTGFMGSIVKDMYLHMSHCTNTYSQDIVCNWLRLMNIIDNLHHTLHKHLTSW